MSKIGCDVTKDLLAPYLDGICSKESASLVEEHLAECAACRQFRDELTAPEKPSGREAQEIDFLKKANLYMKNERAITVFLMVFLLAVFVHFFRWSGGQFHREYLYALLLAPLAIAYCAMFGTGQQNAQAEKTEWYIAAGSLVNTLYILLIQGITVFWVCSGNYPTAIPKTRLGPFVVRQAQISILLGVVMLVLHFVRFRKQHKRSLIFQNIIWCGIAMGFGFISLLHQMMEIHKFQERLIQLNLVLLAETAVLYLICRKIHSQKGD